MLYADSGSPIPNDTMEQFKASDEAWEAIESLTEEFGDKICSTIRELRDRVAALEAKRAPGESPATALAAPAVAVPSDRELVQMWNEAPGGVGLGLRVVWNHGYQQGLAAGRAEQQATTEPPTDPDHDAPQTLHSVALGHVDGLRRLGVIPQICDTLRRAIREPMAEQQAAAEATPEPEPEPVHSQYFSGHGLIAGEIDRALAEGGWTPTPEPTPEPEPSPSPAADGRLVEVIAEIIENEPIIGRPPEEEWRPEARAAIRAVAKWLRSMGNFSAATNLEQEANQ
jgi:hypothetical protein